MARGADRGGSGEVSTVNIKGIDKATLIQALHDGARTGRMTFSAEVLETMRLSREDAEAELAELEEHRKQYEGPMRTRMKIDYIKGRSLKIDVAGPEMHTAGYNRDNGQGAAEAIVAKLRGREIGLTLEEAVILEQGGELPRRLQQ